jgi:hypothetical protein
MEEFNHQEFIEKIKKETAEDIFEMLGDYLKTWRAESVKRIKYDDKEYFKGKTVAADEVAWFIRTELKPKFLKENTSA